MAPKKAMKINVGMAGDFLIINIIVRTGTKSRIGWMVNSLFSPAWMFVISSIVMVWLLDVFMLMIPYKIRAIKKAGIVSHSICLMWVKRSVSATAGAMFVVSDKGDNLSPKKAPEITAPAMIPPENPSPSPIAIKAIPTVAIDTDRKSVV